MTVEGVNIVKQHRKARRAEEQSGIIEMPAPIHALERDAARPEDGRADARTRARIDDDGTKERIAREERRSDSRAAR